MESMLAQADAPTASVELALLDDATMRALHKKALGCDGPTNILSFPAPGGGEDGSMGSLAFSIDTLRREAFLYDQQETEHAIRLLAHGLAHLLGYDHGPAMDALTDDLEKAARRGAERQGIALPSFL